MSHRSHTAIALCGLLVLACGRDLGAGWLQDYRTNTEVLSASAVRLAGGDIALICEQRGRPALVLRTDAGGHLVRATGGFASGAWPAFVPPRLGATADGGFLVAGAWFPTGEHQAALMPFDALGQPGFGSLYSPQIIPSDEYWFADVAGQAGGSAIAVGTIWHVPLEWRFGWVVEIDSAGTPLWGVALGIQSNPGDGQWYLSRVVATPDGGFAALGSQLAVSFRPWLVKFAADRSIEWQRFLDLGGEGDPTVLAVTASGILAVAGATRSSPPAIWLAVLDPSGSLATARAYRDVQPIAAAAIAADPGGGFLIAGERGTRGQDQQAMLMRVSQGGDQLWGRSYELGTVGSWASVWREPDGTIRVAGQLGDAPSLAALDGLGILGMPCVVEAAFNPITEVLSAAAIPALPMTFLETPAGGGSFPSTRDPIFSCPCQAPPAAIAALKAVRDRGDAVLSWITDPASSAYNLWTVPRKEEIDLARRSSAPPAIGVGGCSPPAPVSGASCTDPGAIGRGSPGILFYQVRGDCPPSGEGP